MNHRILSTAKHSFLLLLSLFSQGVTAQDITTPDIQKRAEALIERARQLSDIRSPNAPAFRLKATFSFMGNDLETVEGTYTEVWKSSSHWRRETVIKDVRRIEVAEGSKLWLLDSAMNLPEEADQIPFAMVAVPSSAGGLQFKSTSEFSQMGVTGECTFAKAEPYPGKTAFCFDKKSGLLMEKVVPHARLHNVVAYDCEYGSFLQFGDYKFPREVACFEDRHRKLSATVVELASEPSPDPALFAPPAGAIELGRCLTTAVGPQLEGFLGTGATFQSRDQTPSIRVWFVVDVKGRPQNTKVLGSVEKGRYEKTLNMVKSWRFKPGTCNGEVMAMPLTVEIPSNIAP
jgi:hypothetical protein